MSIGEIIARHLVARNWFAVGVKNGTQLIMTGIGNCIIHSLEIAMCSSELVASDLLDIGRV